LQLVDLMCDIVTLDIIILPKLKEFDCYIVLHVFKKYANEALCDINMD